MVIHLPYLRRVNSYLDRQSPTAIVIAALVCVGVLAVFDYLTGTELAFSLFYVIPIMFVAWHAGFRQALLIAIVSAIAWEEANRLAGQIYSSPAIPFWNTLTRLGFFLTIAALLANLKEALGREQALSRTDGLTGIPNRRAFQEAAQTELERARRSLRPLTIVYIDLDDFKYVNDKSGHEEGDRLLRVVATTLRDKFRVTDTVARLGGDEFAVLLPETGDEAARQLIAKNHQVLLEEMRRQQWPVGFSVGVVTCLAAPKSVDAMLGMADELMYSVKSSGKNATRFSVYPG